MFYAVVFFLGIEQSARFQAGYVYLSEFCLEHLQRPLVTAIAMIATAESGTLCAFYFKFLNKDWKYFQLIGISICLVCLVSVIFIPESPRWLIARGKYKQAFEVFKRIAKVNGATFSQMIYQLGNNSSAEVLVDPN